MHTPINRRTILIPTFRISYVEPRLNESQFSLTVRILSQGSPHPESPNFPRCAARISSKSAAHARIIKLNKTQKREFVKQKDFFFQNILPAGPASFSMMHPKHAIRGVDTNDRILIFSMTLEINLIQ